MLRYKSFSVFKVINISSMFSMQCYFFDFAIADLDFLMFLHEIWHEYFLPERYVRDISCMTSILTIFDPRNGS